MALKTGLTIGAKMTWLGNIWWLVSPGRASKVLPAEFTCHSVWPAAACIAGMHWQRHMELGQDSSDQERVGIVCRREWTARRSLPKSSPEARTQLWLGEVLFEPAGSQDPLCCPPPALWDPLAPPCWHRYVRAEAEEKVGDWRREGKR